MTPFRKAITSLTSTLAALEAAESGPQVPAAAGEITVTEATRRVALVGVEEYEIYSVLKASEDGYTVRYWISEGTSGGVYHFGDSLAEVVGKCENAHKAHLPPKTGVEAVEAVETFIGQTRPVEDVPL
jgi:hypothetical protein